MGRSLHVSQRREITQNKRQTCRLPQIPCLKLNPSGNEVLPRENFAFQLRQGLVMVMVSVVAMAVVMAVIVAVVLLSLYRCQGRIHCQRLL